MSERTCAVCGKLVRQGDETEHLRTNHLGPHYFWFDARKYRTEEPSMTAGEIRKMVDCGWAGDVVEDREGKWIYYSNDTAIDLTHEPHLFKLLPATMWSHHA
jgi:hypothetical protein